MIDVINSGLSLPEFNKAVNLLRYKSGVSGFIAAMLGVLPIEDMKELLETKIQNDVEVAEFIDIVTSKEFKDIVKRMVNSPKFSQFKIIFENYGVNFTEVYEIINELFQE